MNKIVLLFLMSFLAVRAMAANYLDASITGLPSGSSSTLDCYNVSSIKLPGMLIPWSSLVPESFSTTKNHCEFNIQSAPDQPKHTVYTIDISYDPQEDSGDIFGVDSLTGYCAHVIDGQIFYQINIYNSDACQ